MTALPDILFAGDPHGDFAPIVSAALKRRPAAVVLLGDCDLKRPLEIELAEIVAAGIKVHWIPGNHDTDRQDLFDNLFKSKLSGGNIHGRAVAIDDAVVVGLGGVFRGKIWDGDEKMPAGTPRSFDSRYGMRHRSTIFPADFERVASFRRIDVLVTHEAPAATHENGSAAFDRLIAKTKPRYLVHGHHHEDYRKTIGDTIVIGVGRAGVCDLKKTIAPGKTRSRRREKDDNKTSYMRIKP